jgi:anti-sigma B factor antagonist
MATTLRCTETGLAVLPIQGRFDAHQVSQVQQEFDALLTAGARHIILDLSGVSFVDSSALAVLVQGLRRCRERNGELLLCGLQGSARTILELTQMNKALRVFPSVESACAAVKPA